MDRTVLVLGAGVSVPYEYPSGKMLVDRIITKWRLAKSKNELERKYVALAGCLRNTAAQSIDRFLSDRNDFLDVGIRAIVFEMLEAERKNNEQISVEDSLDFFKLFLNQLDEANFERLTILTFNYDRLLEQSLFKRLREFSDSDKAAVDRLKKIKIEHIHGRMPPLIAAEAEVFGLDANTVIPYGLEGFTGHEIQEQLQGNAQNFALKKFKTVYTNDDQPNEAAVCALKRAKRVFFLGFGFDEKNMRKLGIGVKGIVYDWDSKHVAGTNLGMNKVDHRRVMSQYPFISGRLFPVTAKEFFSNYFCLYNTAVRFVS